MDKILVSKNKQVSEIIDINVKMMTSGFAWFSLVL